MRQTIGILDYGCSGNIFNIKKALESLDKNLKAVITKDPKTLDKFDKMVLPGVGAFRDTMDRIGPLRKMLIDFAKEKPILGICLGMQIFSQKGYEFGEAEGLGIIEGEVMKLRTKGRLPHLGWAKVDPIKRSRILKGVTERDQFYFMHSYELYNYKDGVGLSDYCEHQFLSVIEKDAVFGVQFHPEKSRKSGLKVLRNFINVS